MNILIIGDIYGRPGREAVGRALPQLRDQYAPDVVIANCENSAGGKGVTSAIAKDLFGYGVDLLTGERLWESFEPTTGTHRMGHGTAFVVKWGERPGEYIILSETGDLIHARLSREAYEELGRQHVIEPTSEAFGRSVLWSHPAFADGCCFLRNDREIVCVSFRDGEQN